MGALTLTLLLVGAAGSFDAIVSVACPFKPGFSKIKTRRWASCAVIRLPACIRWGRTSS